MQALFGEERERIGMRLRWGWWVRIPRLVLWDERARFRVRAGWLLAAQRQDVAANNVRTFVRISGLCFN